MGVKDTKHRPIVYPQENINFAVGNSDDDERQNILQENAGHSVTNKQWIETFEQDD